MRKISDAKRAAFLAEVRETGNQTLAAARVGVSRSWVHDLRRADPAFDRALTRAIGQARARLARAAGEGSATEWQTGNGTMLVLRGGGDVGTQVSRARARGWSQAAEQRFLYTLSARCNVKEACRAAGLSQQSAYQRRRLRPAFAAAWELAVETGEMTLEATLLAAAMRVVEAHPAPPPLAEDGALDGPPMTIEQVFQVLGLREARRRGPRRPYGPRLKVVSPGELNESILKKLDVLERREKAKRARRKGQ